MGEFLREFVADLRSPLPWLAWIIVSLVVSIAGPFGSYGALSLVERLLFWTPVVAVSLALGSAIRILVHITLKLQGTLNGSLLITGLNCIVLAPLLHLLMGAVLPPIMDSVTNATEIVLLVATISLGVCALRSSPGPALPDPVQDQLPPARLLRRIEPAVQGEIWAISVRDHYVDVQTDRGRASLLMRFSDAIDEVDSIAGTQVHRSHWVAWAGVGAVGREAGKMTLQLHSGQSIPVSRNHREKVDAQFPPAPAVKSAAA